MSSCVHIISPNDNELLVHMNKVSLMIVTRRKLAVCNYGRILETTNNRQSKGNKAVIN